MAPEDLVTLYLSIDRECVDALPVLSVSLNQCYDLIGRIIVRVLRQIGDDGLEVLLFHS